MFIRRLATVLMLAAGGLTAGCAGYVQDYVRDKPRIVSSELTRFGLTEQQSWCVGERMGATLTPRQMREYQQMASSIRSSYFAPGGPNARDLIFAAEQFPSPMKTVVEEALGGCEVAVPTPPALAAAAPAADAPPVRPAPVRAPVWVNLGAAPTGQAIALDAGSVGREGNVRTGWFRLTDPGAAPSPIAYQLWLDCSARTITPLGERRTRSEGAPEERTYPPQQHRALPVEPSTVMEIAYLSLCT